MSAQDDMIKELAVLIPQATKRINDGLDKIDKLESTVAKQAKRIEALETEGVFGKGVLTRLTKLEDWRQDCTGDPFGKFADGYPPVGHPDRRDTQTPELDGEESRKDDFQPKPHNCDTCLHTGVSTTDEPCANQ